MVLTNGQSIAAGSVVPPLPGLLSTLLVLLLALLRDKFTLQLLLMGGPSEATPGLWQELQLIKTGCCLLPEERQVVSTQASLVLVGLFKTVEMILWARAPKRQGLPRKEEQGFSFRRTSQQQFVQAVERDALPAAAVWPA